MTTMTADGALLPASPEKTLSAILALIKNLKLIYTEEVEAISRNDTQKFMMLQPDKMSLSLDYELRVKEIQARAASIKAADPILRQQVIDAQMELSDLADKSQRAALRMAEGIRRLQERLIAAAREAVSQEKFQYNHSGMMNGLETGKPVATAINEAI